MKKMTALILSVFIVTIIASGILYAERDNDIQAIKKALKQNPQYKSGTEAKWFKVLVTDARTKKERVKITLPVSLIELVMKCTDDKHLTVNRDSYDIDLRALFMELKKLGPTVLIEVNEDEEIVKIWLE
jgi:hypothetical protein